MDEEMINLTTAVMENDTMTTVAPTEETADGGGDDGAIYFEILIALATYIYPLVVFGGCLSNAIGFAVLVRRRMRALSVSVYLSVLAVSDSLVLLLDFINNWIKEVAGGYWIGVNTPLCVLYRYSFEVFFTYSAWLVVAITVERLVVIVLPLRAKTLISVSRARIVSVIILVAVCVYKLYNIPIWEVSPEGFCDWKPGWETFHEKANMPLNFSMYSYVPSVILLIANIVIAVMICKQQEKRNQMTEGSASDSSEARRITLMVLSISCAYILLTVPLSAYYTIQYADAQFIDMTPQMALGEMIILLVGLSNHGVNLYLYILVSANFRTELKAMFRFLRLGGGQKSSSESHSSKAAEAGMAGKRHLAPGYSESSSNLRTGSESQNTSQSKLSSTVSAQDVSVSVTS